MLLSILLSVILSPPPCEETSVEDKGTYTTLSLSPPGIIDFGDDEGANDDDSGKFIPNLVSTMNIAQQEAAIML